MEFMLLGYLIITCIKDPCADGGREVAPTFVPSITPGNPTQLWLYQEFNETITSNIEVRICGCNPYIQ